MESCIVLSAFLALISVWLAVRWPSSLVPSRPQAEPVPSARLIMARVITTILSQPGSFNGETYTMASVLANDGAGSMDVFRHDARRLHAHRRRRHHCDGTYSPYHQIPELGTVTSIVANSSGNAVPSPTVTTIPAIDVPTLPFSVAGYMLELDNVTISGETGNFGITNSPAGAMITDGSGNSMTFYYWPTLVFHCERQSLRQSSSDRPSGYDRLCLRLQRGRRVLADEHYRPVPSRPRWCCSRQAGMRWRCELAEACSLSEQVSLGAERRSGRRVRPSFAWPWQPSRAACGGVLLTGVQRCAGDISPGGRKILRPMFRVSLIEPSSFPIA